MAIVSTTHHVLTEYQIGNEIVCEEIKRENHNEKRTQTTQFIIVFYLLLLLVENVEKCFGKTVLDKRC